MLRYRKGELAYYKSSVPKELKKYLKAHPDNAKYVEQFLGMYEYNYVKKRWLKKEEHQTLIERLKGEEQV
jgi:hypothetical protein